MSDVDYTTEEQREEQREIFATLRDDIESNEELSEPERERQIQQLELQYSQLEERWHAEDIQRDQEQNYVSREQSWFSD